MVSEFIILVQVHVHVHACSWPDITTAWSLGLLSGAMATLSIGYVGDVLSTSGSQQSQFNTPPNPASQHHRASASGIAVSAAQASVATEEIIQSAARW